MISIITPTHYPYWLAETWKSLKDQPGQWEWIVVCNSREGVPEQCSVLVSTVLDIVEHDERVRVLTNERRWTGIGERKRDAFLRAGGEILLELDHDDLLAPGALAEVEAAFADPDVNFVYSDWIDFAHDGYSQVTYNIGLNNWAAYGFKFYEAEMAGVRPGRYRAVRSFEPSAISISQIYWAPNHVRAWRRSAYEAAGGHDVALAVCDDHDLVCRTYLLPSGRFQRISKPLYLYRVSGANTWLKEQALITRKTAEIRDKYLEQLVLRECQHRGWNAVDIGSERGQKHLGWKSLDITPGSQIDIVADLTKRWPFEDGELGAIRAHDVIEHLPDKQHTMNEIWRCLRPGGWLLSMTPSTDGRGAFMDPTHCSYWNSNAFWYWTRDEQARFIHNDKVRFKEIYLGEIFPSKWHEENKVPYVRADLMALKPGFDGAGHWQITEATDRSMLGRWNGWYANVKGDPSTYRYADTVTYRMAAAFVNDAECVEDWGCGMGGLKRFVTTKYVGVDGSKTPHVDVVDDLRGRRTMVDAIVMRHVLEHNYDWQLVLQSALASATKKICLVLFTPFADKTEEISHNRFHGVDVPNLSLPRGELEAMILDGGAEFEIVADIPTVSSFGVEHVYYIWQTASQKSARLQTRRLPTLNFLKRVVYTAVFGGFDEIKKAPQIEGIDFVLFTDRDDMEVEGWQINVCDPVEGNPRMAAKRYKMLPHVFLESYDETLWIDGSFAPNSSIVEAFNYLDERPLAVFLHPDRWCIYEEADVSAKMPKYDARALTDQVRAYRLAGHPIQGGLYACGIIARNNRAKVIREFNAEWWHECQAFSPQDQVSFPKICRDKGLRPGVFRGYLWKTLWGTWNRHRV